MKFIPNTNKQYKFDNEGNVFSLKSNRLLKDTNGVFSIMYEHGRRNTRKEALINLYDFLNKETKQIPGFTKYHITKNGEIYSTTTNCWVKPHFDKDGYKRIALVRDDGLRIKQRVCRLVATTYIENQNNYPIVNHIDENKKNDNVENLEWCTISHNAIHSKTWLKRKRNEFGRFA